MKKIMLTIVSLMIGSLGYAGGNSASELGLSSYSGGIGILAARSFPISMPAFDSTGLLPYGEIELGAGADTEFAVGADASVGLLFPIDTGLGVYFSVGAGMGFENAQANFGPAFEFGFNVTINEMPLFIEFGNHPYNGYFAVGMQF